MGSKSYVTLPTSSGIARGALKDPLGIIGSALLHGDATVRIGGGLISVAYDYEHEGRMVANVYEGTEIGQGHFQLRCQGGEASLHRTPGGKLMEGWFHEQSEAGWWRIILKA